MHNVMRLIFSVSLATPCLASAADVAKIEVYADGVRQHSFSFQGPNSSIKISSPAESGR